MLDSIIQKPILSPDAKVRKTSLNTHSCSTPQQVTHSPGLSWRTQNLFLLQHLVTHWSHVADNLKRKISLAAVTSWLVPSPTSPGCKPPIFLCFIHADVRFSPAKSTRISARDGSGSWVVSFLRTRHGRGQLIPTPLGHDLPLSKFLIYPSCLS